MCRTTNSSNIQGGVLMGRVKSCLTEAYLSGLTLATKACMGLNPDSSHKCKAEAHPFGELRQAESHFLFPFLSILQDF